MDHHPPLRHGAQCGLAGGRDVRRAGRLDAAEDVVYLHYGELQALAAGEARDWRALVAERRATYRREQARRQIPRVLLSDGTAYYAGLQAAAGAGATLPGAAVSAGVVEGVAHVVFDPHSTRLAPGEILVCPATDPGWTPLFLAAGGLVMELGGLITHGSVVAREYGIPAVVGVHDATRLLHSGQRIRVDGSRGEVTILDGPEILAARILIDSPPARGPARGDPTPGRETRERGARRCRG